jgi:hypothetical protein
MARSVFFSSHYQRDIMRVQIVKRHYVTKGNYTAAGFFDESLEEKAKKEGDDVVKRLINNGLKGAPSPAFLVGNETYTRRWVHYEIFKSIEMGTGVFGIRIHQIPDTGNVSQKSDGTDEWGSNPFDYLGYGRRDGKLVPMVKYAGGWKDSPYQSTITEAAAPYLAETDRPVLGSIFSVYDWLDNDGYNSFGDWLEKAAEQAER